MKTATTMTGVHQDVLLHTARGLVPAREIEAGDTSFSFNESTNRIEAARILSRSSLVPRPTFEIRVGHRRIRAAESQAFLTLVHRKVGRRRGTYVREWRSLKELGIGDVVAVARATPDLGSPQTMICPAPNKTKIPWNASLPSKTTSQLMWWLGLYIGDGSIERRRPDGIPGRVQIAVYEDHHPVLHRVAAATAVILFGTVGTPSSVSGLRISSRRLAEYLIQNGFGGTALTKRIPEWVHATPTDQRLAFLAGYLDADGTVSSGLNTTVTSANLYLLQDAHRLARSCGLGATAIGQFTTETPSRSIPVGVAYRFGITGDCARIPCRDPRKRSRLAKRRYFQTHAGLKGVSFGRAANHWVGFAKVEAIAELGPCPSVAIALDGATNFVAEGLIVRRS